MNCPKCGGEARVRETIAGADATQRQRACKECGHFFYTTETIVESDDAYRLAVRDYYASAYFRAYQRVWRRRKRAEKNATSL